MCIAIGGMYATRVQTWKRVLVRSCCDYILLLLMLLLRNLSRWTHRKSMRRASKYPRANSSHMPNRQVFTKIESADIKARRSQLPCISSSESSTSSLEHTTHSCWTKRHWIQEQKHCFLHDGGHWTKNFCLTSNKLLVGRMTKKSSILSDIGGAYYTSTKKRHPNAPQISQHS